jgi:adenosine deaminase/adenosine deaminase CECR1
VSDPLQVFTSLYAGFMASSKSPLIVGVNIVAPENNVVALADYTLHMQMFDYLHQRYPNVNRALHAGELTLGMVKPDHLLFHMRQALEIAHAQRIGHGVDLPYEQNTTELLAALKENDTAIEINLTSNQFILGVAGKGHPYLIYAGYGVPLVISTDDSGVSRNNLSSEYTLLASRYHPSYAKIKEYVYNSIKYSFLPQGEKASAKNVLDRRFAEFEMEMAGLVDHLK